MAVIAVSAIGIVVSLRVHGLEKRPIEQIQSRHVKRMDALLKQILELRVVAKEVLPSCVLINSPGLSMIASPMGSRPRKFGDRMKATGRQSFEHL